MSLSPNELTGALMLIGGHELPDIGPSDGSVIPCQCEDARRLAAIERAVFDFTMAEGDLLEAQRQASIALRSVCDPHSRLSDAAVNAYERKLAAMDTLSTLLGVCVSHAGSRRT